MFISVKTDTFFFRNILFILENFTVTDNCHVICEYDTKEVEIININTCENINIMSKSGYFQAKIEWMNASKENPILKVSVPLDVSVTESVAMFKILISDNLALCEELLKVAPKNHL